MTTSRCLETCCSTLRRIVRAARPEETGKTCGTLSCLLRISVNRLFSRAEGTAAFKIALADSGAPAGGTRRGIFSFMVQSSELSVEC